MQARLFVIIGLVCLLALASTSHPAHADTDPSCAVVEVGSNNTAATNCALSAEARATPPVVVSP